MLKNSKNLAAGAVLLSVCVWCMGCGGAKKKAAESAVAGDSDESVVRYAEHFGIEYLPDGVKIVTDYDGRRGLLVPDGADTPDVEADFTVRTPIKKAFFISATQVGFLDALGDDSLYDSVAAVTVPVEDWVIDPVAEGLRSGRIRYIAQSNWGVMDIEAVISLQPDVIFAGSLDPGSDIFARFDEAGLPYAVFGEWLEDSSLASLEWIKFLAAFYNKDDEADAVFRRQTARIDELAILAGSIPPDKRPTVACGIIYDGVVYTQGGDSVTAREYMKAGGRYFLQEGSGGGTLRITPEEFFARAREADILIYNSMVKYTPNKAALLAENPLFSLFKAFKNDKIYILSPAYYMYGARIDVKFEDTVSIFHGGLPGQDSGRKLVFYEKLPD